MVFANVTRDQWARIANEVAEKASVTLDTDKGTRSAKGFTISWVYAPDGTLTVSVDKAPPFMKHVAETLIDHIIQETQSEPLPPITQPSTGDRVLNAVGTALGDAFENRQ